MDKPWFLATSVVKLSDRDAGVVQSIVRLHNSRIDASRADPARFYRRDALAIRNPANGALVIRMAMGSGGGIKGLNRDALALDYDATDALGIPMTGPCSLQVRRARLDQLVRHFWSHPDLGHRISMRLAFLSVLLGLIGLSISLI